MAALCNMSSGGNGLALQHPPPHPIEEEKRTFIRIVAHPFRLCCHGHELSPMNPTETRHQSTTCRHQKGNLHVRERDGERKREQRKEDAKVMESKDMMPSCRNKHTNKRARERTGQGQNLSLVNLSPHRWSGTKRAIPSVISFPDFRGQVVLRYTKNGESH